jgi:hypothetical protein
MRSARQDDSSDDENDAGFFNRNSNLRNGGNKFAVMSSNSAFKQKRNSSSSNIELTECIMDINKRIKEYVDHLEKLKGKNTNPKAMGLIQKKVNAAQSLMIAITDTDINKIFEKFTDEENFSAKARLIKEHRNKSIFNKYHNSVGSIFINDLENLLPQFLTSEIIVRHLKELLIDYKSHLETKLQSDNQSTSLKDKLKSINIFIHELTNPEDSKDKILLSFMKKWNSNKYTPIIIKHRNSIFEDSFLGTLFSSQGKDLKTEIDSILVDVEVPEPRQRPKNS